MLASLVLAGIGRSLKTGQVTSTSVFFDLVCKAFLLSAQGRVDLLGS